MTDEIEIPAPMAGEEYQDDQAAGWHTDYSPSGIELWRYRPGQQQEEVSK